MADTSYLTRVVEPHLVRWAAEKKGVRLAKRSVVVGQDANGHDVCFEFDGVSADGKTGVCASASCSFKTGQMLKLFRDATLLSRANFQTRIMVFIRIDVWEAFRNTYDGLVCLKDITPMFCSNMPPEMKRAIAKIYRISAEEVGAKASRVRPIPKKRSHR